MDIPLRLWDVKNNRAAGKSAEAHKINVAIDRIRVDVNRRYQELMQTDGYVTATKLKNAYLGIGVKQETLLKLFEQHNAEFEKKVGYSRAGYFRPIPYRMQAHTGVSSLYLSQGRYTAERVKPDVYQRFRILPAGREEMPYQYRMGIYDCIEAYYLHCPQYRVIAVQPLCGIYQQPRERG